MQISGGSWFKVTWAKCSRDPISTNDGAVVNAFHPSYAGSINRRIAV
jgi:hypothetical protein